MLMKPLKEETAAMLEMLAVEIREGRILVTEMEVARNEVNVIHLNFKDAKQGVRAMTKPKCIILDIDGTVADGSHRAHLAPSKNGTGTPEDWAPWEAAVKEDPCIEHVAEVARLFSLWNDVPIVVVTGRGSNCHDATMEWLELHDIHFDHFYGRDALDQRPSAVLKEDILLNKVLPQFDVMFALEDQASCVEMFRRNGVVCFHVADGGF